MTREEIFGKVKQLMDDVFGEENVKEIGENTVFREVDYWDSLGQMTFLDSVETAFSVQFEFDDIIGMNSVSDLLDCLQRKTGG